MKQCSQTVFPKHKRQENEKIDGKISCSWRHSNTQLQENKMSKNIANAKQYFMEGAAEYAANRSALNDSKNPYAFQCGEINGVPITIWCPHSARAYSPHFAAMWKDETKKAMAYSITAARLKAKLAAKKSK